MRIGLDATPLLGRRTGVGRYVEQLLAALAGGPDSLVATAFTLRGGGGLAGAVPSGVTARHRPVPARGLQELWARTSLPPVEWLAGPLDVFHGTNFVLPPLRRAAGVVTVHDLSFLRTPDTVRPASLRYRTLVPRSLRRAAVVVAPSHAVAAEVASEYGLPDDRLVVTPLGVDPAWFSAVAPAASWLAARGLPPDYLLFVGSLEPRKGLPVLLDAYRLLLADAGPRSVPPLVLVGPPGWGDALDTAGLPDQCVLTPGYLAGDDLRSVVAGAAALVYPSRYEGFGLPPLEALAAGVPVVASDLPVVREVTGDLASLVSVDDSAALADALAATLTDPGGPQTRAVRQARARTFTWTRCAALTRAAYARART